MTDSLTTLLIGFLSAYAFFLQISLGALAILLIHELTGGRWGILVRPTLLSILPTFYILIFAFLIIGLFSGQLYPVSLHPKTFAMPFFTFRGIFYFGIWIVILRGYQKRLREKQSTRVWAGGSLLALLFSVSFASMDWFMTLIPNWVSTGYGIVFISGCLGAGFAFSTYIAASQNPLLATEPSLDKKPPLLLDLGNLVMMSVLLWAYVSFMQYLIIWSGQMPSELHFYDLVSVNHWPTAVITSALFCFAIPFTLLLSRTFKKSPDKMKALMLIFLFGRWIDLLLWTAPAEGLRFLPALFFGLIAVCLLAIPWTFVFVRQLKLTNETSNLRNELGL